MIKEALQWLADQGEPKRIEGIDPIRFSGQIYKPPGYSRGVSLGFSTLESLVGYANSGLDSLEEEALFVVVDSPNQVSLHMSADADPEAEVERALLAQATCSSALVEPQRGTEDQVRGEVEWMQIFLRSQCVQTATRDELIKALGLIKDEEIRTVSDDGFSQEVTVTDGVRLQRDVLDPIVNLIPYRTFREVDQVESEFLVRVHKGRSGELSISIREADGGAWKIEAQSRIVTWLSNKTELPVFG